MSRRLRVWVYLRISMSPRLGVWLISGAQYNRTTQPVADPSEALD